MSISKMTIESGFNLILVPVKQKVDTSDSLCYVKQVFRKLSMSRRLEQSSTWGTTLWQGRQARVWAWEWGGDSEDINNHADPSTPWPNTHTQSGLKQLNYTLRKFSQTQFTNFANRDNMFKSHHKGATICVNKQNTAISHRSTRGHISMSSFLLALLN